MEQIKELEEVLELLNTKQYTKLRQYLAELNDADIAGLLEELEEEEMLRICSKSSAFFPRTWRQTFFPI